MAQANLVELEQAFSRSAPTHAIPKQTVITWAASDDVEVLGALYDAMCNPELRRRVSPPLSDDEMDAFIERYLSKCIVENPEYPSDDSERYAMNRFDAGNALLFTFVKMWRDSSVVRSRLAHLKQCIERLYREGDDEVKRTITNVFLEHACENAEIAAFFADWDNDPIFKPAYADAMCWVSTVNSGTIEGVLNIYGLNDSVRRPGTH